MSKSDARHPHEVVGAGIEREVYALLYDVLRVGCIRLRALLLVLVLSWSGGLDVPSVGGEISGDLPSVDAKLTGPDVDVEGGGVSLGAGVAAGVTAAVGAAAVGLGLSGKADKPEGEVRCMVCVGVRVAFCGSSFRH